jgi:hypothetical protein
MFYTDLYDPSFEAEKEDKELRRYDKISLLPKTNKKFVEYIPLSFGVESGKIKNREEIYGIISILKPLLSKICQVQVTSIEFIESTNGVSFNPITEFGISVYINPEYYNHIYSQIDIYKIIGYTLLSESSLSRYVQKTNNFPFSIKYINGIAIIPITPVEIKTEASETHIDRFGFAVDTLINEGYFTYSFSPFDTDDHDYVKQLCKMYDISIIDTEDFSCWILRSTNDFRISSETWIRNNLHNIKSGNFPTFTIPFIRYDGDYIRRYGDIYEKYVINYFALLTFAQLSDVNPILKSHIYRLKVLSDNSISVTLPTYSMVLKFKELFEELYQSKTRYTIEKCESIEDAFYKRYVIQQVDSDAYPIAFSTSSTDKTPFSTDKSDSESGYIVIHRSPLAMVYPSPFIFNKNLEALENEMRNFYKKCHDNIEPVSLENISSMTLSELIRIIPITENNVTYCFSEDTLSKIETNPLTRTPLSKETKEKLEKLEYGLRGFFDVGPVFGLSADSKKNPKNGDFSDFGVVKVVRIPVKKEHRDLYGNLFSVQVIFSDGTESDLFEISLPTINLEKIDELKSYADKLWIRGFFINDWQKELIKNLNMRSFYISTNDPILLQAGGSIYDGERALNYMKNILTTK